MDPILVAVVANRLEVITREIGQTMLRTSRSPIFSEARDFATAIFDAELRLVAQTAYIPVLMGSMPFAMNALAQAFGDEIYPGDVLILNDPYQGNNHLPDITVAKPVFYQDQLVFWSVAKGHHADVGGSGVVGYNPEAKTIWEEGLRIPPSKLYERGKYQKQIWDLILRNVRIPFLVEGDLHCQVGAVTVGEKGLISILDKWGVAAIKECVQEALLASERHTRREIEKIPPGKYCASRKLDLEGILEQVGEVKVQVEVKKGSIVFDYQGTDAQVPGFINSSLANTVSSTYMALFTCIDPEIKINEGAFRPIEVRCPGGTLVNCTEPAPCTMCTVTACEAIVEACWLALSQAIPSRVQSAWGRWGGPLTTGFNPRTGSVFAEVHFMANGGSGATKGFDGWDHVCSLCTLGGSRAPDPELHELVNPFRILEYQCLPDSGGAGQWRGGLGMSYRWLVEADGIMAANVGSGFSLAVAPFGLQGGKSARTNKVLLRQPDGTLLDMKVGNFLLKKGDVLEVYSSGGGGFGHPHLRPIEKVLEDVRNGYVSLQSARQDYGVVINPATLELEEEKTKALRKARE